MPVPASAAIASDVGHGALGVRYGLRPMRDLLGETSGQRHVWAELRPKKVMASGSWTSGGGGTYYYQAVGATFDGVMLPVVGVKTLTETLTHLEYGRALTVGTWAAAGDYVYVRLTGDADPAATTVIVELGIHVGSHGVYQPLLFSDRLTNGELEAWSGTVPDSWTVSTSGATLDKTTSDPLAGTYAARGTFTGGAAAYAGAYQDVATVESAAYRASGAYRISGANLRAAVQVYNGSSEWVAPDGRTRTGTQTAIFSDEVSRGEWRRFAFDFIVPSGWTGGTRLFAYGQAVTGTPSGSVDFDDLRLQHIGGIEVVASPYRYSYHEPIIAEGALPTITATLSDAFYGAASVGLGRLGLLNGSGRLEPLIAAYDWHNAAAVVRVGGRFPLDGNEILIDDCPVVVSGRLANPVVTDGLVSFDFQDDRQILTQTLPRRFLDFDADLAEADQGRPRALPFGPVRNSRPPRVDLAANGCGIYELADPLYGSTRTPGNNDVYCYLSEEAADKQDATRRVDLKSQDFSFTTATNRLEILNDVAPKLVTVDNLWLDFNVGGVALLALVPTGLYLPGLRSGGAYTGSAYLCNKIATAMNTVAGTADITCTLSASTHKYTIAKGAGTLQLLCSTGLNRDSSIWGLIGFATSADLTGALTYTGGTAVFEAADQHVIRIAHVGFTAGYADDGSGTYTGSASAAIQKAPDVAYWLLRVAMGLTAAQVNAASFVAARAGASTLAAYIGALGEETGAIEIGEILERIGAGSHADIVSEAGVWYWRARSAGTVPSPVVDVLESDILDFAGLYDVEDNYQIIRVAYSQDASTGKLKTKENSTTSKAALRYGRPEQRTWQTYLSADADATDRATAIATVAGKKPRRFELTVRGKALLLPVGSKCQITRSRGLGTTPPSAVLVRILGKTDDWMNWTSRLLVIEDNPA